MDQTKRFTQEILNRDSMRFIANGVSERIKRVLTATEISDLFEFTKSHTTQHWTNFTPHEIRMKLMRNFLDSRFTEQGREKLKKANDIVDVHEIMKAHIGTSDQEPDVESVNNVDVDGNPINLKNELLPQYATSTASTTPTSLGSLDNIDTITKVLSVVSVGNLSTFMGKADDASLQQLVNPQASYRKNYILLDSRYRDLSQDVAGGGISTFTWNFLANSSVNTQGGVNSLGSVQQLVSISCGDLRIPFQNNALTNAYKRVTLLINEFSGQSYIGQEGRRFHFIYKTELDGNMIECTTIPSRKSTFDFAKPITQIDTFTVSFSCPLEPIKFDMDRMLMSVAYTNPARLTGVYPHHLQTGDQVYMTDFTTNDVDSDSAVILNANNIGGFNVFVINDYTIELQQLDLTTVVAPITPFNTSVYFGSKRLLIPLELKYVGTPVTSK